MVDTKPDVPESRAAARGTLTTLVLRLVSFGCTQATFRRLGPTTLGKANIQLELLLTTVLFLSREGFRLALTRNISSENWNVAWLTIPAVTAVTVIALAWHVSFATTDDPDYRLAGILYCLASWVEGCAEPAVLYFLRNMDVPKRAFAEGLATVVKTVSTIAALELLGEDWQVTALGSAQLMYAMSYAAFLYANSWSQLVAPTTNFDSKTCYLTFVFTAQGCFKHMLTEADRILLTAVSDNYNQGVYAMGSSYGGMAARLLLQPLEENARLLWSRLASREDKTELHHSYTVLVKLVIYVGLLFSCVAVNFTNLLLILLAGRTWGGNAEAAAVLSAFCVFTAFLACNGMTEAFVYAVATSGRDVGRLGVAHTVTGVTFAALALWLVPAYGTVGLVAANCVAMSVRSAYSFYFSSGYFGEQSAEPRRLVLQRLLGRMMPHPIVLASFGFAFGATRWTFRRLEERGFHLILDVHNRNWLLLTGQHVSVGIACVVGIATLAFALEGEFLRSLKSMVQEKRDGGHMKRD